MPRPVVLALPALALALALVGAGSLPAANQKPLFLYVLDSQEPTSKVYAFSVTKSGALTELLNSPFLTDDGSNTAGGQSGGMVYSPDHDTLFTTGLDGITPFEVAADGSLTKVAGAPFGGVRFLGLALVRRAGTTFLYAASSFTDQLFGFEVEVDGSLTPIPGFPLAAGERPSGLTAVGNSHIVLSDAIDRDLRVYAVDDDGGVTLGPNSPHPVPGADAFNLNADPTDPFVYFADYDNGGVFGFEVAPDGSLTPLPGSPFPSGTDTDGGIAIGKGPIFYAFGHRAGVNPDVQAFKQKGTGVITPKGTPADLGGQFIDNVQLDPKGKLLAVVSSFDNAVRIFSTNKKTGKIGALKDSATIDFEQVSAILLVQP